MTEFGGEVLIRRPADEVFDFVADERTRYDPRVLRSEKLTEGPIGAGTKFRTESAGIRRPVEMIVEITTYDRPRLLSTTTRLTGMRIHSTLRFVPAGEETRLVWRSFVHLEGARRLLAPVLGALGRRRTAAIWAGLERALEGRSPASRREG